MLSPVRLTRGIHITFGFRGSQSTKYVSGDHVPHDHFSVIARGGQHVRRTHGQWQDILAVTIGDVIRPGRQRILHVMDRLRYGVHEDVDASVPTHGHDETVTTHLHVLHTRYFAMAGVFVALWKTSKEAIQFNAEKRAFIFLGWNLLKIWKCNEK